MRKTHAKIDIYVRDASGKGWRYVCSTNWSDTCAKAKARFIETHKGYEEREVKALRAKGA